MGRNLLFDAILVRQLTRAANQLQGGVEGAVRRYLRHKTRSKGAGRKALIPNVYRDRAVFHGTQLTLDPLFYRFHSTKLNQWRRTSSYAAGSTVRFQYQASDTFSVELEPLTAEAWMTEGIERQKDPLRYDERIEPVRYNYVCDFEFESQGSSVIVSYSTTETIASRGRTKRDLTTQYRAPGLPEEFGNIGELFLNGLRARGLL